MSACKSPDVRPGTYRFFTHNAFDISYWVEREVPFKYAIDADYHFFDVTDEEWAEYSKARQEFVEAMLAGDPEGNYTDAPLDAIARENYMSLCEGVLAPRS